MIMIQLTFLLIWYPCSYVPFSSWPNVPWPDPVHLGLPGASRVFSWRIAFRKAIQASGGGPFLELRPEYIESSGVEETSRRLGQIDSPGRLDQMGHCGQSSPCYPSVIMCISWASLRQKRSLSARLTLPSPWTLCASRSTGHHGLNSL